MTWKRYVDKVGYKAILRAEKMEQFYVSCVEMSKKTSERDDEVRFVVA